MHRGGRTIIGKVRLGVALMYWAGERSEEGRVRAGEEEGRVGGWMWAVGRKMRPVRRNQVERRARRV